MGTPRWPAPLAHTIRVGGKPTTALLSTHRATTRANGRSPGANTSIGIVGRWLLDSVRHKTRVGNGPIKPLLVLDHRSESSAVRFPLTNSGSGIVKWAVAICRQPIVNLFYACLDFIGENRVQEFPHEFTLLWRCNNAY